MALEQNTSHKSEKDQQERADKPEHRFAFARAVGFCPDLALSGGALSGHFMKVPDNIPRVEITAPSQLEAWLERHHGDDESVWLVTWKAARADKYVSREQVLDVLVMFGWIDGRRMKLDDDRTMQLISRRKQQIWAKSYKDRAERLIQEGRMHPAGQKAIDAARRSPLWDADAGVDALEVPDDLAGALDGLQARAWFDRAAPSYRRNVLRWIHRAKTEPTRNKRVGLVAQAAARGEKVPQF